jgi:hypothetical protein
MGYASGWQHIAGLPRCADIPATTGCCDLVLPRRISGHLSSKPPNARNEPNRAIFRRKLFHTIDMRGSFSIAFVGAVIGAGRFRRMPVKKQPAPLADGVRDRERAG